MKLPQKNIIDTIPFLQLFVDEVEDARVDTLSNRKKLNVKIGVCVFVMLILILTFIRLNLMELSDTIYNFYQFIIYTGFTFLFYQIKEANDDKKKLGGRFKETFKNELYSIIISTLQPTWSYQSKFELNIEDLVKSDIFSKNVKVPLINYCLEGEFNLFPLKAYKVSVRVNHDEHNLVITNYQGIFLKIDLANTTNNRAIVAPRISSQNSNSSHKLNLHQKGYELHNENEVTFNRYFKIYNTQNYDLPEMLTPTFQRQLAHFVLNHKKEVYLSFQKDKLYISIKTDEESVLPSLKGDISPKVAAEHFYNELQITLDLLKRMK